MNIFMLASIVILWLLAAVLGFLLLGTLRALGLLTWRLEQLEATTPKRLGRDGLKPGKRAPDFSLPGVNGKEVGLHDFAGRKVLLVFTQAGCGPCRSVVPELNRLAQIAVGRISNPSHPQVVVVNNGDLEATRKWSDDVAARFPVLAQTQFSISKKYEVFATPFAFLIDEKGVIASKGIINNRQHIRYVLSGTRPSEPGALATGDGEESNGHIEEDPSGAEGAASQESLSHSISSKEISHV
jgi:methylamine dehydrogenase accessory protein MauD